MEKPKRIFIALIMINIIFLAGCVGHTEQNTRPVLEPELFQSSGVENIVWLVQPELEYNSIVRCGFGPPLCGAFLDEEDRSIAINTQTGLPEEHRCWTGTGPSRVFIAPFVYDPQRGLFGNPGRYGRMYFRERSYWTNERMGRMYPLEEIIGDDECKFSYVVNHSKMFIAVESVDSSLGEIRENDDRGILFLTSDADSGKFALMYNRAFVTDFIFDETIPINDGFFAVLFAVRMEDRWGVMNNNGEIVLPFVFEGFLPIDYYTAFAKYNGGYGILDLREVL